MSEVQLRNARLLKSEEIVDVVVAGDRVARITPAGTEPQSGAAVDLDGRVLVPGLWDEHLHFTQWTIQQSRLDLTRTTSAVDVLEAVRRALPDVTGEFLSGYGFRDGNWPEPPSLVGLDAVTGAVPVVLISGDLHCAWMNSAAAARLGAQPDGFGLVRETAWFEAGRHLIEAAPPTLAQYAAAAQAAARRGVVGVVEFENEDNVTDWPARVAQGVDSLRVEVSVWPERLEAAIAGGHRTGDVLDERGLITMGPLKVVVDGSLNTRTALCWDPYPGLEHDLVHGCGVAAVTPDELRELLRRAGANGVGAAVHAIGDRANSEVIGIFEELGLPGSIEHAQLVDEADFARFARLGLVASIQPEHAMDDRDVADRHWAGRTGRAFAYGSLHRAGATLRFGSDAPVAPLDPWQAVAAATSRSRDEREPWHPEQRVPLDVALASSMRGRLRPQVGDVADLAVLEADPFVVTAKELRALPVAATLVGGRFTHDTLTGSA
ncbi:amidohydrolase family protein [Kineosporia rhizophila]|uniref:amidohydrolase n=1 Tax=Kineosporia TaxID=49184 RepID=UPI001E4BFD85|nr:MULTISPECIES: amidohydrolase family protein [Kineosporia]MCE0535296.1 amidohydrolase family protein [Kineosporia rhizophila]GLY16924.1 amidohydrolase [Kineosporia sp. NBRC 101677]